MSELVVMSRPNSAFSEEIKKVRTNLKFSTVNDDMKVIMITSSVPGEGKSFVSSNLAAAFAQADERVLIIDCDLRKGRLRKIFDLVDKKSEGLSNLLIDREWEENYKTYIKRTKVEHLYVIPSGSFPPNPSELLASDRFQKLLDILRPNFDIIILDCPPVSGLNDPLVVAPRSDISIIVTKHNQTSIDLLENTKKSLDAVGAKIAGVIINQNTSRENHYYYYGHYYKD